jgi:hypothetical protein
MTGLIEGRIVHYVRPETRVLADHARQVYQTVPDERAGQHEAAIVTQVLGDDGWINLIAFFQEPFLGQQCEGRQGVPYSVTPRPDTWHWPELA